MNNTKKPVPKDNDITTLLYVLNTIGMQYINYYENKEQYNTINIEKLRYFFRTYNKKVGSKLYDPTNFINSLSDNAITNEITNDDDLFNFRSLQLLLSKIYINDTQNQYNPTNMLHEIIKIDTLFFNMLYSLNLHNVSKSPITGLYYDRPRTKINNNGISIISNDVTTSDINNALLNLLELITSIATLITQLDIADYSTITREIQGDVPTYMYGFLIQFLGVLKKASSNVILSTITGPQYDPSKIVAVAYNCSYGILSIAHMMNDLFKSNSFMMALINIFQLESHPRREQIEHVLYKVLHNLPINISNNLTIDVNNKQFFDNIIVYLINFTYFFNYTKMLNVTPTIQTPTIQTPLSVQTDNTSDFINNTSFAFDNLLRNELEEDNTFALNKKNRLLYYVEFFAGSLITMHNNTQNGNNQGSNLMSVLRNTLFQ